MTIPDGFERMARRPPDKPNWLYDFVKKEPDGAWVGIVIERMRGTIGRERLDPRDAPAGSHARLHTVRWRGFDIDAIEFPEEAGRIPLVTLKAQVPLKPEALQISVVGPRDRRDESLALVNRRMRFTNPILMAMVGSPRADPSVPRRPQHGQARGQTA